MAYKEDPIQVKERARRYYLANKEKIKARVAAWREANPDRRKKLDQARYQEQRAERLAYAAEPARMARKAARMRAARAADPVKHRLQFQAWNYSLPLERLKALLAAGCDACGSTERLHIDHDHACCGKDASPRSCGRCVRGVLCHSCNTAAGLLCEDPERADKLAAHLRRREVAPPATVAA